MSIKIKNRMGTYLMVFLAVGLSNLADAKNQEAFTVMGKTITVKELQKQEQAEFYKIDKNKYDLIENLARLQYLEAFWAKKAIEQKVQPKEAKTHYLEKNIKVSKKETQETLNRFKDHPQLNKLSQSEQNQQIREYLEEQKKQNLLRYIVSNGIESKELIINYPTPKEPIYKLFVDSQDHVRYGPNAQDTKPIKCSGNACPITIVEYSEFQCPFCSRIAIDAKKVLTEYKGKIRWVVRDFPLHNHPRARPAAIAAKCAANQGKYWEMYYVLFANQSKLEDNDLVNYAKQVGVFNDQYKNCIKNPELAIERINTNISGGAKIGVTGTPAFYINGRKLSGALPFSAFKKVIDEELQKQEKQAG